MSLSHITYFSCQKCWLPTVFSSMIHLPESTTNHFLTHTRLFEEAYQIATTAPIVDNVAKMNYESDFFIIVENPWLIQTYSVLVPFCKIEYDQMILKLSATVKFLATIKSILKKTFSQNIISHLTIIHCEISPFYSYISF